MGEDNDRAGHHRIMSSIGDLSVFELEHPVGSKSEVNLGEVEISTEQPLLPQASLVILTDTENVKDEKDTDAHAIFSSLSSIDFTFSKLKVKDWDMKSFYSDYIKEGLEYTKVNVSDYTNVIMLFESPSSSSDQSSFHNREKYKFHDWPPPKSSKSKGILGPCKYSLMNGTQFPSFLRAGAPPDGLMDHWIETVPGVKLPHFVDKVTEQDLVYAYLPVEQIKSHVNDPTTHYHLAGKDAIHLMTQKTTRLLEDTKTVRPCVVKTTHSMGSKGIFIIRDDEDQKEFEQFLQDSGNPTFVVTDFVDIARNVACHFFMHPDGEQVTWFGSNENKRLPDGRFSTDSYLVMADQKQLKRMQLPFVEEVVSYCKSLGFWGFCGVDVLFDSFGSGYLVDINPRVTGSCPALMTLQILNKEFGFQVAMFRRSGDINFYGSSTELMNQVRDYNKENEGKSRIVIHSMYEPEPDHTRVNIGVYGNDMDDCKTVLNRFAVPNKADHDE